MSVKGKRDPEGHESRIQAHQERVQRELEAKGDASYVYRLKGYKEGRRPRPKKEESK